jgi:hypothetical protein
MKEGSMHSAVRRLLAVVLTIFAVALIAAPVSFAGEDDATSDDSGSAAGGVATGAGGMSSNSGDRSLTAALLAGSGILVLTAAGFAVRRRPSN